MRMYSKDAEDIIGCFNQREEKAFTLLYKKYFPAVYSFAKKYVEVESAKDVTSSVFIDLWRGSVVIENSQHLYCLLRLMTRNKCVDILRQTNKEQFHLSQLGYLSEDHQEMLFSEAFLGAAIYSSIRAEVEKLPANMREVFKLSFYEGLKNPVIAERLNFKDSSVRVMKAQALKILRATFVHTELTPVIILLISTASGTV